MEQLSKASQRASRQSYDTVKAEVVKLEKHNFSRIIAFKSGASGEWYKIGGNSMLIYYYEVCQKILNIHPNIQPDTDFSTATFPEGVICVRGLNVLEKRLEKATVLKAKRVGGGTVVYELKITVPEAMMEKLREETVEARERTLAVVRPKVMLDPEVYDKLRYLQRRVYEEGRKMSGWDQRYVGEDAARLSRRMTEVYFGMNAGVKDEKLGWEMIYDLGRELSYRLNFMTDLKIAPVAQLSRMWDELVALERHIKKAYLKMK